ncbi:alkaline phosphatase D family protein [Chromatocurvus halotolerans]|uniref:PhoD-like phosphatase n=1 Tax=Chromatocurvus halotolerans TaxID=1132028 RepID=A0A4V2S9Y7_9GAMM|nr:alkaline phosphatase D family protein [Chromatocurvus halotolerans]TCO69660.1 hypothetical protein EV688_1315 [Chromatocurvus halotolerans]
MGLTDDAVEQPIADRALPPVLAGPIIRRATADSLVLWLVTSDLTEFQLRIAQNGKLVERRLRDEEVQVMPVGIRAFLHLIHIQFDGLVSQGVLTGYDLGMASGAEEGSVRWIGDWAPHLCRPGARRPDYVVKDRLDRVLHGSCRRPHHPAGDGLARVDAELLAAGDTVSERPALLMLTGDQIYADDVAGPMLNAIHQLIERLGLFDEWIAEADVADSRALRSDSQTYYQRHQLLPDTQRNVALLERFFGGARKPVFTTANARNHLISLSEIIAMYLLVWSPVCWRLVIRQEPLLESPKDVATYREEQELVEAFVADLPSAARALAHIPTYMIFDDHDITDDWNLSALWERTVYEHLFSRRIIGNALIGYLLCQGWGNDPEAFVDVMPRVTNLLQEIDADGFLSGSCQNAVIDELLRFNNWHYILPTSPPLVVLDTRTHRWRSEESPGRPSGLMDWEALSAFQQSIIGEDAVIVVSPAPVFGVKLIEVVQRVFTFLGKPLVVDAENWMAHRGTASVLLNIFGHTGTPETFVILSGDVHYSFAYDIRLRRATDSPRIWQITSSGIKNEFPDGLLEMLDRLNRWLYAPRSPLNWLTKRRRMRITPRLPTGREAGERLWNRAGIGLLMLDNQGAPSAICQLDADGGGTRFLSKSESA